jgi:sugar phosphate isomerase/epimerase
MQDPVIDGIGLNTTSLPDGRLDLLPAMLARWKAIGCTHVELTARRLDVVVGGRLVATRCDAVAAMVAEAGLKPVLHANHAINLMDMAEADFHETCAAASIAACARLGAHSMVLHSGKVPAAAFAEDGPRLLAAERERLRRLGDLAGRHGVRLAVENMIAPMPAAAATAYGGSPAALAAQLDAVAHEWVGACLDFGHAFLSAGRLGFDYLAEIEALSPFVWHLHMHDNCGRSGQSNSGDAGDEASLGLGDMHAPMFMGRIPWADLLPRMRFRPRTFGGIELNGRYNAEVATVVATAHAIAAHLNTGAPLADPFAETLR